MKYLDILTKSPIFTGMNELEVEESFQGVRWQVKSYIKGSNVAYRGDDVSYLMQLIQGQIYGVMVDPDGKYVKIEDVEAPQLIGSGFLYGAHHFFPVDVIAHNDVKILYIPREDFGVMMSGNRKIQTNFLNLVSGRAQFLTSKIRLLSRKTIKGKLAHIIIDQDEQRTGKVVMGMGQQNAADLIGVARPSLARTFSEFLDDGIIEGSWKEFTIKRYRELEGFLFE